MFLDAFLTQNFFDYDVIREFGESELDFPKEIIEWMKSLKYFHFEDDNIFAHAYYDPSRSPDDQENEMNTWHRMSDFEHFPSHKYFLTHGHSPRKHGPVSSPNRLNLDIGVFNWNQYAIAEYEQDTKGPINIHRWEL